MALLGVVLPSCTDKTSSDGWTLVWEDEFEGESFDKITKAYDIASKIIG